MRIKIGNRMVGDGESCFIIAEAGSNHNGDLERARRLIDAAKKAGADAVKFQMFRAEKLYVKPAGEADYLKDKTSIFQIIKNMELPLAWLEELRSYCDKNNVVFLSSVFDDEGADVIDKYVPVHKIASYECNHLPLIEHVAKKGKPIILSTGASSMEEIMEAVEAIRSHGNERVVLMQCTAKYPTPLTAANLRAIPTLKNTFDVPVGFSDHTSEPFIAPMAAVALGANVIEKHFTLDKNLPGPDHKFALEPAELETMVRYIRETEKTLGDGEKAVLPEEKELYDFAKRAVHATKDIKKGETFGKGNVAVLRSGRMKKGMPPKFFEKIIDKKARRDIKAWEGVSEDDFE